MQLGLLGTGMIVKDVLPVLTAINGIELKAILSTKRSLGVAETLAEQFGIEQVTSDIDVLLANTAVDTVYIGTPNHTHYDYAKKALLAGKHVICEKPFTLDLSECDDLIHLAQERGLFLLEAITNQYLETFDLIKKSLSAIGEVKIVNINYSQYSSRYDAFKDGEIAPVFDPKVGGGALRDINIYNIHLLLGLFGSPRRVDYLPNMERGVDTSGILILDYDDFKAVAIGAKDCDAEIASTIQGTKGSISIFGGTNSLSRITVKQCGQEEITHVNPSFHRMYDEFVAFEAILSEKDWKKARAALAHSRAVMQVLQEASRSLGDDDRTE